MRGPIQTRRYGSLLRALWGLGGGTTPGDEASDQAVQVSIDLEPDLSARPELGWPGGEVLGQGIINVGAGGAGTRSKVLLFNPLGSGMITVIEQVRCVVQALYQMTAFAGTAGYTLANIEYARDTRQRSPWAAPFNKSASGGLEVYTRNNNAVLAGEDIIWTTDTGVVEYPGYILKPGTGVIYAATGDNTAISNLNIRWRSRSALPQELNA